MKKIMTAAVVALLAVGLTGCKSDQEYCEEQGGTYVKTGSSIIPITSYIRSGDMMIPITNYVPYDTYECQGVS